MGRKILQDTLKQKKKLLIATDSFLPRWDGIASFLAELIPRIKEDYDITVIAPAFKGYETIDFEVKMVWVKTFNFKISDYQPARFEKQKIKEAINNADIVWAQSIGPIGATTIKHAKKARKPLLAYNHSIEWELASESFSQLDPVKFVVELLVWVAAKRYYNKCDLLLVPSQSIATKLDRAGIKTPKKTIKMGIDFKRFINPENKEKSKKELGLNKDDIIIGFCGRLGREKDLVTLYRAFIQLEHDHKNIKLLIVGDGIEKYKKMFSEKENIIMTGAKNNVVPYLQAMDIFVLPSITETSSLATMEAMSCGLAVITTKVGSIPEYVVDRKNGMFFPTRNSFVLRKKLEMLIKNPQLRKKLGEEARETIQLNHSWEKTLQEIKEVLNKF